MDNARHEGSTAFMTTKRAYLKDQINELETNGKRNIRDLYRGINEFERGYQPRLTW
jgi:hypothetical protein